MFDKRGYTTYNALGIWTPRRYSEIYERIDDKSENNRKKYLQSVYLIGVIIFIYSYEPKSDKYNSSPKDDRFSTYLYEERIVWAEKSPCPNKEIGIERKKRLYHFSIVLVMELFSKSYSEEMIDKLVV